VKFLPFKYLTDTVQKSYVLIFNLNVLWHLKVNRQPILVNF